MRNFVYPDASLGTLDAASAASLIASAADIALVLDSAGVIVDLALRNDELLADLGDSAGWIGRPVAATVMLDSRPKVEALLQGAADNGDMRWRHVNHRTTEGRSIPVLYCCAKLPGGERMVMFGRDLRVMSALQQRLVAAQQSLERDYSRLREVEVRYRLLFQHSTEAVVILDAATRRVVEANPSARTLLGTARPDLAGTDLSALLTADTLRPVQVYLAAIAAGSRAEDVRACLEDGQREVRVRASSFRQGGDSLLLVRVVPIEGAAEPATVPDLKLKLLRAVESAPDGFVVTDGDGDVLDANAAFLQMVELQTEEQARGRPLDRWLGNGADMNVLFANLRSRGSVRFFATTLRSEAGTATEVEVSAVSVRNGPQPSLGFAVRDVGARVKVAADQPGRALPRSVEQVTELIGRVPLKDLVRDATEVIERLCIEAALDLTRDNRASAAEMLGLSRQSLYVKLRRYGLGDGAAGEEG